MYVLVCEFVKGGVVDGRGEEEIHLKLWEGKVTKSGGGGSVL